MTSSQTPSESFWRRCFGIDLRALAAFRIAFALLMIVFFLEKSLYVDMLFTDSGVLPRWVQLKVNGHPYAFSLSMLFGNALFQWLLWGIGLLSSLALLVGFRSNVACFGCWLIVYSFYNRCYMDLAGAETQIMILLFWGCFLPLGACWSLDSRDTELQTRPQKVFSTATIAILLQVLFVYFFAGLLKTLGPNWGAKGTALYYVLSLDIMGGSKPFALWLMQRPSLLKLLTPTMMWAEILGPLLFFTPWKTSFFRTIGILSFFVMNLGILFAVEVGFFPFIDVVALLLFIPSSYWDRLSSLTRWLGSYLEGFAARLLSGLAYCRLHPPVSRGMFRLSLRWQSLAALCLVYIIWRNIAVCAPQLAPPTWISNIGYITGLKQQWTMFGPTSSKMDVWFVIPGRLKSGKVVDVSVWFNKGKDDAPVQFAKPKKLHLIWRTHRMSIYFWMMARQIRDKQPWGRQHLRDLSSYLCRRWNREKKGLEALTALDVYMMLELTPPPGQAPTITKQWLHLQHCPLGQKLGTAEILPGPRVPLPRQKNPNTPSSHPTTQKQP
ncbi:MAG: hypothetical protein CL920_18505 [Deltaproteobacteria bacterium]|nr:hypothetical protein [Deltaproteobacteria bacterium]MBU50675.1 hypothetical protein [Deltaproteobacteria bacterium]